MRFMSPSTSQPARVAVRTATAVRKLTTDQIQAIMEASGHREGRVLPILWETVRVADPALVHTLDEMHAKNAAADLPRFEALRALHTENIAAAATGPAGRRLAGLAVGALLLAPGSVLAMTIGMISASAMIGGIVLSLVMAGFALRAGRRIAASIPTRVFADPHHAASIVWDTAVDAAASAALRPREGEAGLTPDVLGALSSTWTSAGLSLDLLVPVVRAPRAKATAGATPARAAATKRAPKAVPAEEPAVKAA